MNWKKTILFIFLVLIGLVSFNPLFIGFLSFGYVSLFQPIFFVAYVVFLSLLFKNYSKKRLAMLIAIFVVYFLILLIPFPECDLSEWEPGGVGPIQECTCLGIKKHSWGIYDASWTQCVGIPIGREVIFTTAKVDPQVINRLTTLQEATAQQIEAYILEDFSKYPNEKLISPLSDITLELNLGEQLELKIGVKNVQDTPLTFTAKTEVLRNDGQRDESSFLVETPLQYTLAPLEAKIYPVPIKAVGKKGVYLIKLKIINQQSPELVYAEKNLFVEIIN